MSTNLKLFKLRQVFTLAGSVVALWEARSCNFSDSCNSGEIGAGSGLEPASEFHAGTSGISAGVTVC